MPEILKIIELLALGQGLLVALLLITSRFGHRYANCTLAAFVGFLVLLLWNSYVGLLGPGYHHWRWQRTAYLLSWLWGPLLYLYAWQLSSGRSMQLWQGLKHSAGMIAAAVWLSVGLWLIQLPPAWVWDISLWALYVQLFTYLTLSLRLVWRHRQRLVQQYSNLEQVNLTWLQRLLAGFAVLMIVDAVVYLDGTLWPDFAPAIVQLLPLCESLYVFAIGLFALRQPEIVHADYGFGENANGAAGKYQHSSLSTSIAQRLLRDLQRLMDEHEPYLDNRLTMTALAQQLKVRPHHLSQALNEHLGQSFYDYINSARIERAKRLLLSPKHQELGVLDIAFEVGFNNKTSFNSAFKKYTGTTPSQFRRQQAA